MTNGIWAHINYEFPDIFDLEPSQLDIMFLSNWSMRTAAPILNVIHDSEATTPMLSDSELTTLAGIINGMYKFKWDKLMATALTEYDPIHNYYDELTETIGYSEGVDVERSESRTNANTRTDDLSEVVTDARRVSEVRDLTNSGGNSVDNGIYGFNSSTSLGESDSVGTNSNTESGSITTSHAGNLTTANTGTQTDRGSNSLNGTEGKDTEGSRSREYTKTGNIGNISTQKLMKEEIELWKYNFVYEIMRDVAKFVSLPIYEQ